MLCRVCNEREVPEGHKRNRNYICSQCHYGRYKEKAQILNRRNGKRYRKELRERMFDAYGRECVYCHSTTNLQFDHTNGDGCRKTRGYDTRQWFLMLIAAGFPPSCQVVCGQCNVAKQNMTDAQFRAWIKMVYHAIHGVERRRIRSTT